MSSRYPPLTCKIVKKTLKKLGFDKSPSTSGSSHEQYKKVESGKMYKVTVDCPKAPFSQDLISSMARQAGMTKKEFYKHATK